MSQLPSQSIKQTVDALLANSRPTVGEFTECLQHEELPQQVPAETRRQLLQQALQQAVELEFGTIPIYLCALWSIKNNLDPVAKSIRNVVQEEMLHMALACNMLSSIGGKPKIYDTTGRGLTYPTKLPGGVHPELTLRLTGLTDDALDDFLEIELPHEEITFDTFKSKYSHAATHSETIGQLYDAINHEFQSLKPAMSPDHQVTGPLSWFVVDNLEKVNSAINWIKEQGEGSVHNSPNTTGLEHLSHFYRFWEVRRRQKIELDPVTKKFAFKSPLAFPDVWPMAVVPEGGYRAEDVTPEVARLLSSFDQLYSYLIHLLESAWGTGGQAAMWRAIETMFALEKTALPLMKIPIPGGKGNYGPCFRLVEYHVENLPGNLPPAGVGHGHGHAHGHGHGHHHS